MFRIRWGLLACASGLLMLPERLIMRLFALLLIAESFFLHFARTRVILENFAALARGVARD